MLRALAPSLVFLAVLLGGVTLIMAVASYPWDVIALGGFFLLYAALLVEAMSRWP